MPAKLVQFRRGTTPEHSIFTGKQGEITVDITKNTVIAHDEVTQGGHPLAKEDLSNVIGEVGITQLKFNGTSTAGNFLSIDENGEFLFNPIEHPVPDIIGTSIGGDLSGTISNAQIVPNTVGASEISSNAVSIDHLNVSDGTTGQVLSRNGSGGLAFIDVISDPVVGGDISGTISNAQIKPNIVGITELDVDDGLSGHVLSTDGSGGLSFVPRNFPVGAGAVLQTEIVSTGTVTISTGGSSYSAITDLQGSITPTATTSKIFLSGNVMLSIGTNSVMVRIMRSINSGSFIEVGSGPPSGNRESGHTGIYGDADTYGPGSASIHFVDTPTFSLGQSIVYRFEAKASTGTSVWYCNTSINDVDTSIGSTRTISGFTIQELS